MITKIKTSEGKECLAIILQSTDYKEIVRLQRAIIYIMQASTQGDLFTGIVEDKVTYNNEQKLQFVKHLRPYITVFGIHLKPRIKSV